MPLTPKRPPGRHRLARRGHIVNDIRRLHAEGYTLDAIREALADEGVVVSKSTVQRELAWRPRRDSPPEPPATPAPALPPRPPSIVPTHNPKDVADEVFGDSPMSNPLYRSRSRQMKVAVISFSGNVGKTTIARHLLAPRIPGAQLIAVESINAEDGEAARRAAGPPVRAACRSTCRPSTTRSSTSAPATSRSCSTLMRRYRRQPRGLRLLHRPHGRRAETAEGHRDDAGAPGAAGHPAASSAAPCSTCWTRTPTSTRCSSVCWTFWSGIRSRSPTRRARSARTRSSSSPAVRIWPRWRATTPITRR
ncbi:MAG: hypothetical protein MZW92_29645 [Comamonadaceae bacterium]|nr:hypothetical protein [Comamonadaceae bacterium]